MPKLLNQIHAKDKSYHLQNERKQELNRLPHKFLANSPKKNDTIETNAYGMIFFIVLNAELLQFGSTLQSAHAHNSQSFFMKENKLLKQSKKFTEFNRDENSHCTYKHNK